MLDVPMLPPMPGADRDRRVEEDTEDEEEDEEIEKPKKSKTKPSGPKVQNSVKPALTCHCFEHPHAFLRPVFDLPFRICNS